MLKKIEFLFMMEMVNTLNLCQLLITYNKTQSAMLPQVTYFVGILFEVAFVV